MDRSQSTNNFVAVIKVIFPPCLERMRHYKWVTWNCSKMYVKE